MYHCSVFFYCQEVFSFSSVQLISVAQSCPTLWDPMNCSMSGVPVHHQLLEFTQTLVHRVSDTIQPSHPLLSPFPPAPNQSQIRVFSNESTLLMRWPRSQVGGKARGWNSQIKELSGLTFSRPLSLAHSTPK